MLKKLFNLFHKQESKVPTLQDTSSNINSGNFHNRIGSQENENISHQAELLIEESSKYLVSNPQKSIELINQVLKNLPNNYDAYVNRGIAYDSLGDFEKAIDNYKQSININPNYYLAYVNLASIYKKLGNKSEALELYKKTLAKIPPTNESEIKQIRIMISELEQQESTAVSEPKYQSVTIKLKKPLKRIYWERIILAFISLTFCLLLYIPFSSDFDNPSTRFLYLFLIAAPGGYYSYLLLGNGFGGKVPLFKIQNDNDAWKERYKRELLIILKIAPVGWILVILYAILSKS